MLGNAKLPSATRVIASILNTSPRDAPLLHAHIAAHEAHENTSVPFLKAL
jgi:hypothetical protein